MIAIGFTRILIGLLLYFKITNFTTVLTLSELNLHVTSGDLERLEEYVRHQCETPLIADLLPALARLYFLKKIPDFKLKPVQAVSDGNRSMLLK